MKLKKLSDRKNATKASSGGLRAFNFVSHLRGAKSDLTRERSKTNLREKVNEKINKKNLDKITLVKEEFEKKKLEVDRKTLIITEKYEAVKKIQEFKRLSNYLKTETSPSLFWKPSEGKLEELMKKNRDHCEEEIKKIKEESYDVIVKKVKEYDEGQESK
mmetsp:Transcript_27455/g.24332  ORF Transcript_27455/g.24332 Transcript_27455/m.24332 type:complete len:160 (-) Transcript_27455:32-511(-)